LISVGLVASGQVLAHALRRQGQKHDADEREKPGPINTFSCHGELPDN